MFSSFLHIFFHSQNPPGQELNAHGTSLTKRQAKKSERKKEGAENGNDKDEDDAFNGTAYEGTMNNSVRSESCNVWHFLLIFTHFFRLFAVCTVIFFRFLKYVGVVKTCVKNDIHTKISDNIFSS